MPFLPLVLLLVGQALSRSASFALGWATALFFGQIPGNKGRMVSVISLISVAWVALVAGFAVPLLVGAVADALGVVSRNFDVRSEHALGIGLAIGLVPPVVAGVAELAGFEGQRSAMRWLRRVPVSYSAVASLGVSVLQMLLLAPVIMLVRLRQGRVVLQVPLLLRPGGSQEKLSEAVAAALRGLHAGKVERGRVEGPLAWPLRTVGYAARNLLGAVVRGDPVHLRADGLELFAYGTDVAVLGKEEAAYPARAAIERELALGGAYLTWSQQSQALEDELIRIHAARGDRASLAKQLDRLRERIDAAPITSDEWNVLDRLRLQLAQEAVRAARR
ncbi:MAG: hypothetical protein ABJB65_06200 [Chloroflexota bacterium]